jgi:AraC-like DNA-binding protein/CheY-like chemotaxis protein
MSIVIISATGASPLIGELDFVTESVHSISFSAGIKVLTKLVPEVVLLDCENSIDSGINMLEAIKEYRNDLPVIFLADEISYDLVLRVFRAGAREFFRAPFETADLLVAINSLLKFKRQAGERRVSLQLAPNCGAALPPFNYGHLPENILRATRFIQANISTQLTLETIAREANLSKFHFCRVFKSYVGVSPKQFTLMLRINHSMALLKIAGMTISTVALRAGFNDLGEFTRQFRKIVGQTPSGFRNTLKSSPSKKTAINTSYSARNAEQ